MGGGVPSSLIRVRLILTGSCRALSMDALPLCPLFDNLRRTGDGAVLKCLLVEWWRQHLLRFTEAPLPSRAILKGVAPE